MRERSSAQHGTQAIELVASRFEQARDTAGAESILPFSYGGSNGLLTQDNIDAQLWRRFGTSRLARTLCAAPTGAANPALYGKMPSVVYQDYPHAKLIILWGINPSASGIHIVPFVREAQKRGATLVVIDPRTTPLARSADIHLADQAGHRRRARAGDPSSSVYDQPHRPWRFLPSTRAARSRCASERSPGRSNGRRRYAASTPSSIARVAELYATSSPALIRCGWGLERNRNGGNAAMAVLALPAVGGKFGVRGGGYSMSNSASWNIERTWIEAPEPDTRIVNMNQLGRALTEYDDPPVNVLFVYNCNPAATVPDQRRVLKGLEREDLFTVVFEQVMTDTALYADVLLPNTTFLEGYDFAKGYGSDHDEPGPPGDRCRRRSADQRGRIRRARRAARPAVRRRTGGRARDAGQGTQRPAGPDRLGLREGEMPTPPCGPAPIQFVDVFPNTPDRKVDLFPAALDAEYADGAVSVPAGSRNGAFPARADLAGERSNDQLDARRTAAVRREAASCIPTMRGARGLADGDLVRVFNELGEVHCALAVEPSIRPGTVSLPKGLWRRSTKNGVRPARRSCPTR